MKKIPILLFILISIFYSCDDKGVIKSINEKPKFNTQNFIINPANDLNPYDSMGYYHNQCLDYIVQNLNGTSFDSVEFKNTFANLIASYANQVSYEVPASNCYNEVYSKVMNYFSTDIYLGYNGTIEKYSSTQYVKNTIYDICNDLTMFADYDSTSENVQIIIDSIKNWEAPIIINMNLTELEKKQILSFTSVIRYSLAYWQQVYENNNHPWHNCIECNPQLILEKNDKLQLFDELQNMPWYYKVLGCAVADGSGSINGGWIGAGTYTAVAATIYWWDEVCDGAEWLWNGIKSGCNWLVGLFK